MDRGTWLITIHGVSKSQMWLSMHEHMATPLFQAKNYYFINKIFPGDSEVKASACNEGDLGSVPGSGRSLGEGNGNPLQYSCLENLMDGGAWWGTDYWVAKSQTWLSKFTFTSLKILFCFFMFQLPNKSILYFFFFIIPVSEIPTDLQSVSLAGCYLKFSFSSLV